MKTTDSIANTIDRFPNGYVFTYTDFVNDVNKKEAVVKALNRMVAAGKLSKLSKGKYYKSEKTVFGDLQPNQREIVKDLLEVFPSHDTIRVWSGQPYQSKQIIIAPPIQVKKVWDFEICDDGRIQIDGGNYIFN